MITVNSATIIKVLNAILSFVTKDEQVNFICHDDVLSIFSDNLRFDIPYIGEPIPAFAFNSLMLKSLSTLKASLVEEQMTLTYQEEGSVTFKSSIEFTIFSEPVLIDLPEFQPHYNYVPSEHFKVLSKFLSKFSKDNFKGSLLLTPEGFVIPGEYHLTEVKLPNLCEIITDPFNLASIKLNKLLKLGQDIAISETGLIYSQGGIEYQVQLYPANQKAQIGNQIAGIRDLFTEDFPILEIQQPKLFKDFIKNAKSGDRQYDLCRVQTEENRISLSFYKDKKPLNKFVYNQVSTPENYIEFFIQVKHLTAISELALESIKIQFCSNTDPLKVTIDDSNQSYIMQGLVI